MCYLCNNDYEEPKMNGTLQSPIWEPPVPRRYKPRIIPNRTGVLAIGLVWILVSVVIYGGMYFNG